MSRYPDIENYMVLPGALERYYAASTLNEQADMRRSAYSETERRLYALPMLRERVEEHREELAELEQAEDGEGLRQNSPSLVRLLRPGMRLDPEEVKLAQLAYLRARLAADEREIKKMQAALQSISEDPYYLAVELRYLKGEKDASVAERLCCDPTTVRRNRSRLVRQLAARLYGAF